MPQQTVKGSDGMSLGVIGSNVLDEEEIDELEAREELLVRAVAVVAPNSQFCIDQLQIYQVGAVGSNFMEWHHSRYCFQLKGSQLVTPDPYHINY